MPNPKDEVGVLIGVGNSIQEAIDHLKDNLKQLKKLPVFANMSGFVDLIESIIEAEKFGLKFADVIPDPKSVL
jgi:hypothetical protein